MDTLREDEREQTTEERKTPELYKLLKSHPKNQSPITN